MIKKAVITVVILTVISVLGWQIYSKSVSVIKRPAARKNAASIAVETAQVRKTSIRDAEQFTGSLLPVSQFIIAPKVSGRLKRLFVHIGDTVSRKQLIAVLDDEEFIQQVEEARAELAVAKANLEESKGAVEISRRELERSISLREKKIISQSDLDTQEANHNKEIAKHKVALAQVAQKEAALKTAEVRLSYTRIHASWEDGNGRRSIGERFVDEGALLQANSPIVSVIDISHLVGVIHVTEKDYLKIRTRQDAVVNTDALPGKTFPGKVVRIAPLLKETSREARVDIDIPNSEGQLKPGMFVRAGIEFARHDNATVVPFSSVVRRREQYGVFLADIDAMKARFVPVELGIVNSDFAEIVEPELSGYVITLGQHLLDDGSAILLPDNRDLSSGAGNDRIRRTG